MEFKEELANFSDKIKELQTLKDAEYISDVDTLAALIVLNFIKCEKVSDIFLSVAALNMLNIYM